MNPRFLVLRLTALGLLCVLPRLEAVVFTGTITQTVTETNDPRYQVGQTWIGSYTYESPTMDGTFARAGYDSNLQASLFAPFSPFGGSDPAGWHSFNGGSSWAFMNVTDGAVNGFTSILETGAGGNWYMISGGFGWSTFQTGRFSGPDNAGAITFVESPVTRGSFSFGAPTAVPDDGSTALLLGSVLGVMAIVRRFRNHWSPGQQ